VLIILPAFSSDEVLLPEEVNSDDAGKDPHVDDSLDSPR
jgi:hypothetical protein